MKFLVKITGPKGYSKQGQVEAANRNQAEAEMYRQLRDAGMKAGYKVKVLMTLNKDSALSVDEIKTKYVIDKNGVTGNERRPVTYWAKNVLGKLLLNKATESLTQAKMAAIRGSRKENNNGYPTKTFVTEAWSGKVVAAYLDGKPTRP